MNPFTYVIHSITPLQTENERYSSLADIYTASCHDNISIEMVSDFIFINRNRTFLIPNTPIDVFGGLLDAMANIFDETEIKPDVFLDASDNKWI